MNDNELEQLWSLGFMVHKGRAEYEGRIFMHRGGEIWAVYTCWLDGPTATGSTIWEALVSFLGKPWEVERVDARPTFQRLRLAMVRCGTQMLSGALRAAAEGVNRP